MKVEEKIRHLIHGNQEATQASVTVNPAQAVVSQTSKDQPNVSITFSGVIRGVTPKDVDQTHTAFEWWRGAGLPDPEGTILEKVGIESGRYNNVKWYAHVTQYTGVGNKAGELGRNETTVISWSGTEEGPALAQLPDPGTLIEGKNLVPLGAEESQAAFQSVATYGSSIIKMAVVTSETENQLPENKGTQAANFSIFQEKI